MHKGESSNFSNFYYFLGLVGIRRVCLTEMALSFCKFTLALFDPESALSSSCQCVVNILLCSTWVDIISMLTNEQKAPRSLQERVLTLNVFKPWHFVHLKAKRTESETTLKPSVIVKLGLHRSGDGQALNL